MKHIIALALLASTFASTASGQSEDSGAQYTSFAGYVLGQQNLDDVQSKLGTARLRHVGEAGNSEYSICYRLSHGTVTFKSGELGGPSHVLLGFDISSSKPSRSCTSWPASQPQPAAEIANLHIGMLRSAFTETFAQQVSWQGQTAKVSFHTQGSAQGKATDIVVMMQATFHAGKLRSLTVWRTETT